MRSRGWPGSLSFVAAALAALLGAAAPVSAEKVRNHFDADSVMRPPGFFDAVVLKVEGGRFRFAASIAPGA